MLSSKIMIMRTLKVNLIKSMMALLTVAVITSCSLQKDPLSEYSDVTEGVN